MKELQSSSLTFTFRITERKNKTTDEHTQRPNVQRAHFHSALTANPKQPVFVIVVVTVMAAVQRANRYISVNIHDICVFLDTNTYA